MRNAPMRPIPLSELVAALRADPLAFNAYWSVYCQQCETYYHVWPDRGGLVCAECQMPLVSLVAVTELSRM